MALVVSYSAQSAVDHVLAAMRILATARAAADNAFVVLPRADAKAIERCLELALQELGTSETERR